MNHGHTVETLRAFEEDIAAEFNAGRIRAPVHLSWNNEQQLLDIFRDVGPTDWICSTWRSHYHALLRGVPPAEVKAAIMAGRSITLTFPKHRVISSAIVGGIIPIALGLAWAIKRKWLAQHGETTGGLSSPEVAAELGIKPMDQVWVFVGDMTAETGTFHECQTYASGHQLPIQFVIEYNGKSVLTDTFRAWGGASGAHLTLSTRLYTYDLASKWPHAGAGQRVQF